MTAEPINQIKSWFREMIHREGRRSDWEIQAAGCKVAELMAR